jgi:multidrug resistance efflux pump
MKPNTISIKFFFVWLLVVLLIALLATSCDSLPGNPTLTPTPIEFEDAPPIVSATGQIIPKQWSRLSVSVPGIVEEVLIQEGDQVQKDDLLIRLEGTEDLRAAIAAAQTEVIAAQKVFDDLEESAQIARTNTLDAIALAEKQVRDAQYQLDNFTPPQDQLDLDIMEAIAITQEKLDQARQAFEPYRYYPSGNQTRKDLKEDLDLAQADYNSAIKRLEYETALTVAEDNLKRALEDYETLKDGPDPKEVELAQANLDKANADLNAAVAALDHLDLRAPFAGTISELSVHIGEYTLPQNTVILIADLDHFQIETTDLNEIDAARVRIGEKAMITFDALPDTTLEGTITQIAPKSSAGSGVNYTATIEISDLPEILRWGMTAFIDIEVEN